MSMPRHSASTLVSALALGVALTLGGCAAKHQVAAVAPSAPPPVGHVYPVAVAVPAPMSTHIKFTAKQAEQAQQAFNVIGLKSALMVGALTCGQQTSYDTFMSEFQPHVLSEQHMMDAYFRKASGHYSGQKMEDAFVTQLANNQSIAGETQGSMFCLNTSAEFTAVLALRTSGDLDHFVTDQPPTN